MADTSERLLIAAGIIANIMATSCIVVCNKYLYARAGFHYMVALSCIHFIATSFAQRLFLRLGLYSYKHADWNKLVIQAGGTVMSVAFMNLNLAYNSVGFYQLSKLVCIPATIILQYFLSGKTVSTAVQQSLVVIMIGVGVATVSDVELNALGFVFAVLAVLSTTTAQLYTNTNQSDLGLDAMQLLYHCAPMVTGGLAVITPFFDQITGPKGLLSFDYTPESVMLIIVTSALAVGVNVTNFFVIGKTSPLTYQVVGHLKTVLILTFGFVMFGAPVDPRNMLGIVVAVGGMVAYSELRRRENVKPVVVPAVQLDRLSPAAASAETGPEVPTASEDKA